MIMNTLKIIAFPVLLFISASGFAQTVTAWGIHYLTQKPK